MKKTLSLTIVSTILFLIITVDANAATPTPTPETKPSKAALNEKLNEQISQLKEKIASRVSELNLVEKRGVIGTVTEVSGGKITIKDVQGNTRFIDVDEITKFSSASNKSFGLSDLTKGTKISALGLYNKQSKRLLARFINTSVDPVFISGTITDIDTKNFLLTVTTVTNKQVKLDNQTSTKIYIVDNNGDLVKSGFSKFEVGDRVSAIGFPDKKDATMIVPNRIITLPDLAKNPNTVVEGKEASKSGTSR